MDKAQFTGKILSEIEALQNRLSADDERFANIEYALENNFIKLPQTDITHKDLVEKIKVKYFENLDLPENQAREIAKEYAKELLAPLRKMIEEMSEAVRNNEKIRDGVSSLLGMHGIRAYFTEYYYKTARSRTRSERRVESHWSQQLNSIYPRSNVFNVVRDTEAFFNFFDEHRRSYESQREKHLEEKEHELNRRKTVLLQELSAIVPKTNEEAQEISERIIKINSSKTLEELKGIKG